MHKIAPLVFSLLLGILNIGSILADDPAGTLRKSNLILPATRVLSSGLLQLLGEVAVEGNTNPESYHSNAFHWLENSPNLLSFGDEQIIQRYVLACIHYSTNSIRTAYTDAQYGVGATPPGWVDDNNWLGTASECDWHGITCDEDGKITAIDLSSNGLTGRFPPVVSLLKDSLRSLVLTDNLVNNIGDAYNAFLGDLDLQYLYIGSTNFDYDGIPTEIGRLSNLIEFDCSYSLYQGPLRGEVFANMPNLKTLVLSGNAYNSSVPAEIAALPELQNLYIEEAFVEGDLSFVESMPKIVELHMDFNPGLKGEIPGTIALARTLETLSVSSCGITGAIPSEIGRLVNMREMFLYGNNLTGSIPSEIGRMARMKIFELEMNSVTGTMPNEVCALRSPAGLLDTLEADCNGEISCSCCTACFGVSASA